MTTGATFGKPETISGSSYRDLGNKISAALTQAIASGMGADEAACVAVQVAVDCGHAAFGPTYAAKLADIVIRRGQMRHAGSADGTSQ